MSDIIHLLPDSVANQIAAGEVIQRPASVIKELMENSIDACAKQVKVIVKGAGRTSIHVIDDGKGMSATDARMAFERHATSKIKAADDLFTLQTMGFRGEALPSIVAVSTVELRTRTADDEVGTLLEISASKVERQEDISTPIGTSFLVKNLFFNIPARRKFLKSDEVELRHIVTEFQHVALATPQVAFSLYNGDSIIYDLPAGTFRQRIVGIFGKKSKRFEEQIIPINLDSSIININGFIGKPEIASKNGNQFFFVNGRYMRHPYFHRAVMQAYNNMIASDMTPSYFINLTVNPQDIDVNISPTKTEIKFDNERDIWQVLLVSIKESLGKFNIAPSLDFANKELEIPVFQSNDDTLKTPDSGFNHNYNPFSNVENRSGGITNRSVSVSNNLSNGYQPKRSRGLSSWDELYSKSIPEDVITPPTIVDIQSTQPTEQKLFDAEANEQIFLYKGRWLMTAVKSGILIVDSYRANERITYETLLLQLEQQQCVSQQQLFPEVWELTPELMMSYDLIKDDLHALGFQLSSIGRCAFNIEGIPAVVMDTPNITKLLDDLLAIAHDNQRGIQQELYKLLTAKLACCSAQHRKVMLTQEEMRTLIDKLFACQEPTFTPDGKCIAKIITDNEWLSQF